MKPSIKIAEEAIEYILHDGRRTAGTKKTSRPRYENYTSHIVSSHECRLKVRCNSRIRWRTKEKTRVACITREHQDLIVKSMWRIVSA